MIINTRAKISLLVFAVVSTVVAFLIFFTSAIFNSEIIDLRSMGLETASLSESFSRGVGSDYCCYSKS